jgi:hypothetical protein
MFINHLDVVQPGARTCPLATLAYVDLRFLSGSGRGLADAVEHPTGCASVSLSVGGRRGPSLSDYPAVSGELRRLLHR